MPFIAVVVAAAMVSSTRAEPLVLGEPHLNIIPRTEAERARIETVTTPARDFSVAEKYEGKPAGAATVRARDDSNAFSDLSGNMPFESELNFKLGNGLFRKLWVSAPSSTQASDGLGPLYNARSCQRCHLKDGRGHPPEDDDDSAVSMFLRISVPAAQDAEMTEIEAFLLSLGQTPTRVRPDPVYGGQLQDFAVPGQVAEYRLDITYDEITLPLSGGEVAQLRVPSYRAADLGYGPLAPGAMLSPRVAPPMIGLGLIEAIPVADIIARADPQDDDGDGISGRAQVVWSFEHQQPMLGRFGLKAGAPTIREQSAAAFAGDIGLSTPIFDTSFGDCTVAQVKCRAGPHGDKDARIQEVGAQALDLVSFYSRNLAVPARRNTDNSQVLRGKEVFYQTGCTACHRPKFVTHRLKDQPEQSFQLIWPYSDILLHDMGEGLADNRPEGLANGREWRTAPLWGIGLTAQVSGHTQFLHDGRARNLLEAILWHGGEAETAKNRVVEMPPKERAALVRFLESL